MANQVKVFESLAFGFREFWGHVPALLPLSLFFFVPEFSGMAGKAWPGWAVQPWKALVFFGMLFTALKRTGAARERTRAAASTGKSYAKAELIKWMLIGLSVLGAFSLMSLTAAALSPQWMSSAISARGWMDLPFALKDWWLNQNLFWKCVSLALFIWLPLRAHVALNFFGFLIVDKDLHAIPAIRASIELTRHSFWQLALLYLLCLGLDLMGLAAYVIGAVFTFPITLLATIHAYRSLVSVAEAP